MDNKIIVYVDDAAHAQQVLSPLLESETAGMRWVLVACAPRMTHRISKWVSHRARENWRDKWADKLFAQLLPGLTTGGSTVTTVLAKGPLAELTQQLQTELGAARVVDARRPKLDAAEPPHMPPAPSLQGTLPGLLTGLGAWLALDMA